MFSPAVITSRAAEKDYNEIVANHTDILKGYATQANKVDNFQQQRSARMTADNELQSENKKANMVTDTQNTKNANDFATKQAEIDIKRAQISAV